MDLDLDCCIVMGFGLDCQCILKWIWIGLSNSLLNSFNYWIDFKNRFSVFRFKDVKNHQNACFAFVIVICLSIAMLLFVLTFQRKPIPDVRLGQLSKGMFGLSQKTFLRTDHDRIDRHRHRHRIRIVVESSHFGSTIRVRRYFRTSRKMFESVSELNEVEHFFII